MAKQVLFAVQREGLRLLGAALAVASCLPMLVMLPSGIVTVLALLGITATSAPIVGLTAFLAPAVQPLLPLSVGLLVVGHLRQCGWSPALLAATGGLLLYLAMYMFVTPLPFTDNATTTDMPRMTEATAVSPTDGMAEMGETTPTDESMVEMVRGTGMTNGPLFYLGLTLLVGSFGLARWRQHSRACRPIFFLPTLRAMLARRG